MTDPRVQTERRVEEAVPGPMAGQRLDRFLAMVADISRNEASAIIADRGVSVNNVAGLKPSHRLTEGDVVAATIVEVDHSPLADPSVTVPVIYQDDDVMVIEKPAGMVVHSGAGVSSGTLVHGLLALDPGIAGVGDDPTRPGIVHRLDRGTSGLLMVARTNEAHAHLSAQLAQRSVHRRYLTLVMGDLESSEGLIDAPLGRSPREATRQAVVVGGRVARTHYEVLERFSTPATNLLSCRLETGRTHQIRVHLEAIGHPVVGDDRYTGTQAGQPAEIAALIDRPFLHATELGFEHPVSGELLRFDSPLPADLQSVLDDLRAASGSDDDVVDGGAGTTG